jgi:hypothetical protein
VGASGTVAWIATAANLPLSASGASNRDTTSSLTSLDAVVISSQGASESRTAADRPIQWVSSGVESCGIVVGNGDIVIDVVVSGIYAHVVLSVSMTRCEFHGETNAGKS